MPANSAIYECIGEMKMHYKNRTVLPDLTDERIRGVLQQRDDVLVEWVGVLHEPVVDYIVDTTGIVHDAEVRGRLEVGHDVFDVVAVICLQQKQLNPIVTMQTVTCSLSMNVLSVAFGNQHSSSSSASTPIGLSIRSMVGCRSRPKSINFHSMPSRRYSSCSSTNIVVLNSCCSFSFV